MTRLSAPKIVQAQSVATATLTVETPGEGFTDITREVARFVFTSPRVRGEVGSHRRQVYAACVN